MVGSEEGRRPKQVASVTDYPEEDLMVRLAPTLNQRLGGALVVWEFTASFMPNDRWISRMDYTLDGEDQKAMKSVLMEGRGYSIYMMRPMKPRIFRVRPSVARLRAGLIMLELENPDPGERYA